MLVFFNVHRFLSKKVFSIFFFIVIIFLISGCETSYYLHMAKGQFDLLYKREKVEQLLASETTDISLKNRLLLTQKSLHFAQTELQLPVTGQYSSYVALDRPYALWSLSAAPALELTQHKWCYPLIGCASYRGFFDLNKAEEAAKKLQSQGLETYIRGVSAYSTLGWFNDPLLSSFAQYNQEDFVELLFHELAHAKLYIPNDTTFNESFASFVGQESLRQFKKNGHLSPQISQKNNTDFRSLKKLINKYKQQLQLVFESHTATIEKEQQKANIYHQLQVEYEEVKQSWQHPNQLDHWMKNMNNAKIMVFNDYDAQIPLFEALFKDCNANWQCFYKAAEHQAKQGAKH